MTIIQSTMIYVSDVFVSVHQNLKEPKSPHHTALILTAPNRHELLNLMSSKRVKGQANFDTSCRQFSNMPTRWQ